MNLLYKIPLRIRIEKYQNIMKVFHKNVRFEINKTMLPISVIFFVARSCRRPSTAGLSGLYRANCRTSWWTSCQLDMFVFLKCEYEILNIMFTLLKCEMLNMMFTLLKCEILNMMFTLLKCEILNMLFALLKSVKC